MVATYEPKTNDTRPDAEEKIAIRCPRIMKQIVRDAATERGVSETEVVLGALEHEFSRYMIYKEDFYEKWAPIVVKHQQRRLSYSSVVTHS